MKKKPKNNNLILRMNDSDLRHMHYFQSQWSQEGVDMNKSQLIRNALELYMDVHDHDTSKLEGNMIGVRIDPNKYNFNDLYNLAMDMQKLYDQERNQSRKYLFGKMFELMSCAINLEFNVSKFKDDYKIRTPEDVTQNYYHLTKRIIVNFDGDNQ